MIKDIISDEEELRKPTVFKNKDENNNVVFDKIEDTYDEDMLSIDRNIVGVVVRRIKELDTCEVVAVFTFRYDIKSHLHKANSGAGHIKYWVVKNNIAEQAKYFVHVQRKHVPEFRKAKYELTYRVY